MNKLKFAVLFLMCIGAYCCSESRPNPIEDLTTNTDNNSGLGEENLDSGNEVIKDTDDFSNTDFNILFIGNSLTYTNNLPAFVKNEARLKGINIGIKMIAFPNYAILDHWNDGNVQAQLASGKYYFVIIQQGPSSQAFGRQVLIEYAEKYSDLCKKHDAQLGYFMVWPALANYQTFEGAIKNHQDAALINNAILCPVGKVWKEHFDATDNFDYYGSDNFHPSLKGSQVAAKIIVESLFP